MLITSHKDFKRETRPTNPIGYMYLFDEIKRFTLYYYLFTQKTQVFSPIFFQKLTFFLHLFFSSDPCILNLY